MLKNHRNLIDFILYVHNCVGRLTSRYVKYAINVQYAIHVNPY